MHKYAGCDIVDKRFSGSIPFERVRIAEPHIHFVVSTLFRAGRHRNNNMSSSIINSMFSLEGRTALVTGGTRGIGAQMAIGLAEAGADVILVQVRNPSNAGDPGRSFQVLTPTSGIPRIRKRSRKSSLWVEKLSSTRPI